MKFCVLVPSHAHIRTAKHNSRLNISKYFGLKLVLAELLASLNIEADVVTYQDVHKYDVVLASIHSVEDYWGHAFTFYNRLKGKRSGIWICGGSAVQNLPVLSEIFDFAFVGRAEEILVPFFKSLLSGNIDTCESIVDFAQYSQSNVYRINYVQRMSKVVIGKEQETMLGCKYNCAYCRYRIAALPPTKRDEDTETTMPGNEETFWELKIESSKQYTTSLDGLTEAARYAVSKRISNQAIYDKFAAIGQERRSLFLKVYLICGYPGQRSVDFSELREVLRNVDAGLDGHNFNIKFHVTPFSAEPGTPMQWEPVNIVDNYNDMFKDVSQALRNVYVSENINAYVLRTTMSNWSVFKRAVHHRSFVHNLDVVRTIAADPFFRSHDNTHGDKLNRAYQLFDVDQFVRSYPIGAPLSSSNIVSWRKQKSIENQARTVRMSLADIATSPCLV